MDLNEFLSDQLAEEEGVEARHDMISE